MTGAPCGVGDTIPDSPTGSLRIGLCPRSARSQTPDWLFGWKAARRMAPI